MSYCRYTVFRYFTNCTLNPKSNPTAEVYRFLSFMGRNCTLNPQKHPPRLRCMTKDIARVILSETRLKILAAPRFEEPRQSSAKMPWLAEDCYATPVLESHHASFVYNATTGHPFLHKKWYGIFLANHCSVETTVPNHCFVGIPLRSVFFKNTRLYP